MGRWTPLILMAGGLAILLGTLLGISFPMGGQQNTAQVPQAGSKKSEVLPANINVNSTASGNAPTTTTTNKNNVAQNSNTNSNTNDSGTNSTPTDSNQDTSKTNDASQNKGPVQALW
ncbi:MAG: hypothetical protein DSM106950_24935 [Stigonema ocellatum SAG 48.90 = DSM 106950]|nr:hypothetical protein [Stigonema ocellatum SAG 48.90 = DSM 106950]